MRFKGHEQAKNHSFTGFLLKMKLEHFSKLNLCSFNCKSTVVKTTRLFRLNKDLFNTY